MNAFDRLGIVFMFIGVMPKEHSPGWLSVVVFMFGMLVFVWSESLMRESQKENTEADKWDVQP